MWCFARLKVDPALALDHVFKPILDTVLSFLNDINDANKL